MGFFLTTLFCLALPLTKALNKLDLMQRLSAIKKRALDLILRHWMRLSFGTGYVQLHNVCVARIKKMQESCYMKHFNIVAAGPTLESITL